VTHQPHPYRHTLTPPSLRHTNPTLLATHQPHPPRHTPCLLFSLDTKGTLITKTAGGRTHDKRSSAVTPLTINSCHTTNNKLLPHHQLSTAVTQVLWHMKAHDKVLCVHSPISFPYTASQLRTRKLPPAQYLDFSARCSFAVGWLDGLQWVLPLPLAPPPHFRTCSGESESRQARCGTRQQGRPSGTKQVSRNKYALQVADECLRQEVAGDTCRQLASRNKYHETSMHCVRH